MWNQIDVYKIRNTNSDFMLSLCIILYEIGVQKPEKQAIFDANKQWKYILWGKGRKLSQIGITWI